MDIQNHIYRLLTLIGLLIISPNGWAATLEFLDQQDRQRLETVQQTQKDLSIIEEQYVNALRTKGRGEEAIRLEQQAADLKERIHLLEKDGIIIQELRQLLARETEISQDSPSGRKTELIDNLTRQKGLWESQLVKKKDLKDILMRKNVPEETLSLLRQDIETIQNEIKILRSRIDDLKK